MTVVNQPNTSIQILNASDTGITRTTTVVEPKNGNGPMVGDDFYGYVETLLLANGTSGSTTFTNEREAAWNVVWTGIGSVELSDEQVFEGSTSIKFPGSGSYLEYTDTNLFNPPLTTRADFCMEVMVYITKASDATVRNTFINTDSLGFGGFIWRTSSVGGNIGKMEVLYDQSTGGTLTLTANTVLPLNSWHHIAISHNNGNITFYLDGVNDGTVAAPNFINHLVYDSPFFIGHQDGAADRVFVGYMDLFRITIGHERYSGNFTPPTTMPTMVSSPLTDPDWAQVESYIPFDEANGSTTFTDAKGISWLAVGSAATSNAESKNATTSLRLPAGTGDYVRTNGHTSDFDITSDFTIEGWFNLDALGALQQIFSKNTTANQATNGFELFIDANRFLTFGYGQGSYTTIVSNRAIEVQRATQWQHFAVCRSGSVIRLFQSGWEVGSSTITGTVQNDTTVELHIGRDISSTIEMTGYVQDFRFTNTARYTRSFGPWHLALPTQ